MAIHMALTFLVTRFGSPPAPLPAEVETTWFRRRMQFDMTGTLLGVLAAYVLFVVFIGREGNRYVRVHTEMALARDIHQALVPRLESRIGPYDVVGASHPAGDVGGDLVDVVATNDGWFAYVVDVSGHGVSSGVLMGMTKSAVRMRAASEDRLDALLDELNRTLIPLKKPNMFATFAGLRVGTEATLEYTLAGHLPLLHVRPRPAGEPADVTEHHIGQIPLGVTDDYHFRSARIGLEPGDLVVLVTDGLTEVFDRADRELGLDGVKAVLAREARAPLGRVVEELQRAAGAHGPQLDDQTVLLLRYAPGPGSRERTRPV